MKLDRLIIAISAYPVHSTSPLGGGGSRRHIAMTFGVEKSGVVTPWWNMFEDIFIRFDTIHERDRHTHRRTDIMQTVAAWRLRPRLHSIERQKSVKSTLSIVRRKLTRDKKSTVRGKTFHMFTTYSPKYSTSRIVRTTYDRRNNVGKHRILCS